MIGLNIGNRWDRQKMVPSKLLLEQITTHFGIVERIPEEMNDTARNWRIPGFKGQFGFISSASLLLFHLKYRSLTQS
jgi:molybdenum cofactor biosynthesis enzyme MoaA